MSGERALQSTAAPDHEPNGHAEVALRPRQFCVGDPVPRVLTLRQLADNLQISERALLVLRKAGTHRGVKQLDAPGDPRFCGRTFEAWLNGTIEEPVRRHFFGSARKR